MELTYMVLGADGKEYGPVTLNQISGWISEGRVPAQQQVRRSDMQHWAAASAFDELRGFFAPASASAPASTAPPNIGTAAARPGADPATAGQLRSGASWFYWIAGLSLVNSIVSFTGGGFRFLFGLGITRFIDAFGAGLSGSGAMVALLLNILTAGLFILFGVFANKCQLWAFIAGMVLFALDGLLFVLWQQWVGVAFHAFALYCLFRGFTACRELRGR